jgi:very-short-patch-repair endonuclease
LKKCSGAAKQVKLVPERSEVDGNTHKTRKWKFLDRRKESVLSFLGWIVLRFWNEEVTNEEDRVAETIFSTISKLKGTTIT